ncbi:extracellular solute-binding protein [Paenibacillus psychroresistens]|uniref:Extracellular solute-binding protein n=1 Tax=Paenibacillus psychroresistens TaxID=1778678 RepID=A0A6B8RPE4_9BACL|nr:extracellular solute-binding protein [Paenibacillus psychroresistens]QGQ97717.1 extracellular solute-binding protein [Paenibacillus psychroresistens]
MKKNWFKVMQLTVVASMVLSIAACGSSKSAEPAASTETKATPEATTEASKEPNKVVTIKLWHQWASPSDGNTKPFRAVLDAWNKANPNIQIVDEGIDGESYKTKIKTAVAASEMPDVFYAWGAGFAKPFVEANAVLPLDDYLNDGTKDKVLNGALVNLTYNGKVYGLPANLNLAPLYINKEIFDNNGVKIPTTFDELLAAVKAFRAKGITPITVGEKDLWPGMYWYDILALRSAGATASQAALEKKASFDQPEFIDAASKLVELVNAKAFNDSMFAIGYPEMVADFTQGKAAMLFQGTWVGGSINDANSLVKGKIVAVPFPIITGGKGNVDEFFGGSVDAFFVSQNSKYKEEAVKVVKYITENMSNQAYAAGASLPAWKVTGVDVSKIDPLTKQTVDMIKNAKSFTIWWDTFLEGKVGDQHKNLVANLFYNKMKPEEFAKEMQKLNVAQ